MLTKYVGAWLILLALNLEVGFAGTIFVANPSFEVFNPLNVNCGVGCQYNLAVGIPSWNTTGAVGSFQPGSPATTTFFDSVPNGLTVAYANNGSITQTVAPTVALGVTYTLMVDVGNRKDLPQAGVVALLIGSNSPIFAPFVAAVEGGFATYTVAYTGIAADVGKTITIVLGSTANQGDFDNVRLSDDSTSAVPEPGSGAVAALGLAALAVVRRRSRE